MTEPTGDGPDIDARRDQFSRGVVAAVAGVAVPTQPGAHPGAPPPHRIGLEPRAAVWREGEDARVGWQLELQHARLFRAAVSVGTQQSQRSVIERDAPLLVRLGVLLPGLGTRLRDARPDCEHSGPE